MLTKEQTKFVREHVDPDYYDIDKLTRYLEMHDIVGNEIFQYCDKRKDGGDRPTYSRWLDDEDGYQPLPVDQFIHRVPFYFYTRNEQSNCLDHFGNLEQLHYCSYERREKGSKPDFEEVYEALEYAFYDLRLPLSRIFSYWIDQTDSVGGDLFFKWYEYLKLREGDSDADYFPERFITSYNEALEDAGLEPIIYEVQDIYGAQYFFRTGTRFEFEGQFPCNSKGEPILKWIGIRAQNIGKAECTCKKSETGRLFIDITPTSVIHLLNIYNEREDEDDAWYQVYAGPLCMEFDFSVLKFKRKQLKFTQQEVADAIGATVRTYQKWENGETTPDGHYLLRLMNWLDIPDAQYAVKYSDLE